MFWKVLSRRIPALLTTMSSWPNCSSAVATMAAPPSGVATELVSGTASPPAATISSTTRWAGPASPPSPDTEPPTSLTTTLAPRAARSNAWARPRPPPAPVTIATLPSKPMSAMGRERSRRAAPPARRRRAPRRRARRQTGPRASRCREGSGPALLLRRAPAQRLQGPREEPGHVHLRDAHPLGDLALGQAVVEPQDEDLPFPIGDAP